METLFLWFNTKQFLQKCTEYCLDRLWKSKTPFYGLMADWIILSYSIYLRHTIFQHCLTLLRLSMFLMENSSAKCALLYICSSCKTSWRFRSALTEFIVPWLLSFNVKVTILHDYKQGEVSTLYFSISFLYFILITLVWWDHICCWRNTQPQKENHLSD